MSSMSVSPLHALLDLNGAHDIQKRNYETTNPVCYVFLGGRTFYCNQNIGKNVVIVTTIVLLYFNQKRHFAAL